MVSAVAASSVPALQGQMRQAQAQLNDWTTCVSSKTTKGQAEIQKLSGEVSADREHIARALQTPASRPGSVDVWA